MKYKEKKEFYIVDKRILPKSIQNVIKVDDLIAKTKMSKYAAIKKVGISRSTYYKYKDFIKASEDMIKKVDKMVTKIGKIDGIIDIRITGSN